MNEAIDNLKYFVAEFFDGTPQRCRELDELLWEVRLANKHEPEMLHVERAVTYTEEIDLEELGL